MNVNELIGKALQDEYLKEHEIVSILNEGGQGAVYTTKDSKILIKLLLDSTKNVISNKSNPELFERLSNDIRYLNKIPFPENIHIAYPMAVLTDYAGYVMRFLDETDDFRSLMNINTFPETGSYRRRFEMLSKVASILSELHANGLIYCDLSPNNIFISKNPFNQNQNAWLIDADNIHLSSPNNGKLVYTQRYAAPEIINQKSKCTFASDSYSFATLAFETLASNHPFDGGIIEGSDKGESVGWDASITKSNTSKDVDALYSGNIPWIEDPEDKRNHTENGLPREFFLNEILFRLFNQTFTDGKESTDSRPPMYFWAKALAEASDTTVSCKECSMSHLYDETRDRCPFCDEELKAILLIKCDDKVVFTREVSDSSIYVPERVFVQFNHKTNSIPFIIINVEKHEKEKYLIIKKEESVTTDNFHIYITTEKHEEELFASVAVSLNHFSAIHIVVRNKKTLEEKIFELSFKGDFQ